MTRKPDGPKLYLARPCNSRGFSLVIILIMMGVLALLALGAMKSGTMQERMVGNARDHHVALQAAEAALRDAEQDIESNANAAVGFTVGCTNGLCIAPSDAPPGVGAGGPQSAPLWQNMDWATNARAYGSVTSAPALLGPGNTSLASQPRYFIERLPTVPGKGESVGFGGGWTNAPTLRARAYRITVRASGIRAATVVILQSVYVKQ